MCGDHSQDGTPIDHHHGPAKRIFLPRVHPRSRRAFLGQFGRGTIAMAVVSPAVLGGCSSDGASTRATTQTTPSPTSTAAPTAEPEATPRPTVTSDAAPDSNQTDTAEVGPTPETDDDAGDLVWARANLGFVSAYVLARGNRAAIVDTGTPGSATAIGETLGTLGLTYSDVAHVILTHNHGDHAGSIGEVLEQAINATAYAGEADLGSIPGDITGLVGGEDIFGFEMLATPGHTPGHMAVIDHQAGVLVAGDAIFTEGGGVVEGPERFFDDVAQSRDTIKALASLTFNTLLAGHGDPIEFGADTAVAALAQTL